VSPSEWARLNFGSFQKPDEPGVYLQLWCIRHDCNVGTIHIPSDDWWWDGGRVPLRIFAEEGREQ